MKHKYLTGKLCGTMLARLYRREVLNIACHLPNRLTCREGAKGLCCNEGHTTAFSAMTLGARVSVKAAM